LEGSVDNLFHDLAGNGGQTDGTIVIGVVTISSFVDRVYNGLLPSRRKATSRKGSGEQDRIRKCKGRSTFFEHTWVETVWTGGSTRVTKGEQLFYYAYREMQ
jgi:hypothetical protein